MKLNRHNKTGLFVLIMLIALAFLLVGGLPPLAAHAAELTVVHQFKDSDQLFPADYQSTDDLPDEYCQTGAPGTPIFFWHFVATVETDVTAYLYFTDGFYSQITVVLTPYKTTRGSTHYGVYMPAEYYLVDGYLDQAISGKFNLSHTTLVPEDPQVTTTDLEETTTTLETTKATQATTTSTSATTTTISTTTETEPQSETVTELTETVPLISSNETSILETTDEEIPATGEHNAVVLPLLLIVLAALVFVLRKILKNIGPIKSE